MRGQHSDCRWDGRALLSPDLQLPGRTGSSARSHMPAMPWHSCALGPWAQARGQGAMLETETPRRTNPRQECHSGWQWLVLALLPRAHTLTCPAAAPVCPSGEPSGAGCRPPSAAGESGTAPASVALSHGCHCRGCTWTSACRDTDVTHCQCQGQHRLDPGVLRPALGVLPHNTRQRSSESRRGRVGA